MEFKKLFQNKMKFLSFLIKSLSVFFLVITFFSIAMDSKNRIFCGFLIMISYFLFFLAFLREDQQERVSLLPKKIKNAVYVQMYLGIIFLLFTFMWLFNMREFGLEEEFAAFSFIYSFLLFYFSYKFLRRKKYAWICTVTLFFLNFFLFDLYFMFIWLIYPLFLGYKVHILDSIVIISSAFLIPPSIIHLFRNRENYLKIAS
jgi:hypothetical protein